MAILGSVGSKFYLGAGGPLYEFTSHTFTTAGVGGRLGPTLAQVRTAYASTTWASTFLNMDQQGIQLWTVPRTGSYLIVATSANGGWSYDWGQRGGYGSQLTGTFTLNRGSVLKILCGQEGTGNSYDGGGGGGTFVTLSDNTPLIIAGGGGGGAPNISNRDANFSGTNGYNSATSGTGGSSGSGGGANSTAGGGGGLLTNGGGGWPGFAFVNGGNGGSGSANGGFGGGGAGGGTNGAGGGGGYSGGSGSSWSWSGGGGGSFNAGASPSAVQANSSAGTVAITRLSS